MPTAGVYAIRNKITGKQYIGQSGFIEQRWEQHIAQLHNNSHSIPELQTDWAVYGTDGFDFVILYESPCQGWAIDAQRIEAEERQQIAAQPPSSLYNRSRAITARRQIAADRIGISENTLRRRRNVAFARYRAELESKTGIMMDEESPDADAC